MNTNRLKILAVLLTLTAALAAQDVQDAKARKKAGPRQLIRAAMLDYVEGIYDAKPERIARTVSPELDKVGILRQGKDQKFAAPKMTYAALHKLAGSYNKDGKRIPKDAPKTIEILGVLPRIAVAKLTAAWGIDYIQLCKTDAGWKIRQITWQRAPKPVATAAADRAAVTAAAQGYARAFYQAKPQWVDKHVDPELAKYGFYQGRFATMDFKQLRTLARHAFPSPPEDAREDVQILDLADNTAAVKLTGAWGIDFINLVRTDAGWKIRQVIWQSHPPAAKKTPKKASNKQKVEPSRRQDG